MCLVYYNVDLHTAGNGVTKQFYQRLKCSLHRKVRCRIFHITHVANRETPIIYRLPFFFFPLPPFSLSPPLAPFAVNFDKVFFAIFTVDAFPIPFMLDAPC